MLDFMRKKAGSWMIKFILGAIIIVFVFWGVGSFTDRNATGVATVNGEVIQADTYREAYNTLLEQVRQRFGSSLNDDLLKALNLRKQALDRLTSVAARKESEIRAWVQSLQNELTVPLGEEYALERPRVVLDLARDHI